MLSVEHLNGVVVHCQGDRLQRHVNLREMSVTQLTKHFCLKLVNSFSLMVREFLAIDYLGTAQPVLKQHTTASHGTERRQGSCRRGPWGRVVQARERSGERSSSAEPRGGRRLQEHPHLRPASLYWRGNEGLSWGCSTSDLVDSYVGRRRLTALAVVASWGTAMGGKSILRATKSLRSQLRQKISTDTTIFCRLRPDLCCRHFCYTKTGRAQANDFIAQNCGPPPAAP